MRWTVIVIAILAEFGKKMAVTNPVKVKPAQIVAAPITSFDGGLDERGDHNIAPNCYSYGLNVAVNSAGNITKRLSKRKWLPDTVGFNGEVSTIYYNNQIYYIVADDGKVKYCQENDTTWTDFGGANAITTTAGVITTFMRTNNLVCCMNGTDSLRYIDLATFDMVQFTFVADPTNTLTATASGISASGPFTVYYGMTYNSDGGGETAVSNILSQAVSKSRTTWLADGTEYLTISFNDTPPTGATSRNIYAAIALQGTTPVASDLVRIKGNIPLSDASFVDNGSFPFDISVGFAPSVNSTAGIKASRAEIMDKTPIFYGDPDNPYDLVFGSLTDTGISVAGEGSQRLPLLEGTNYYPTSVIGFRNNQNIPTVFTLFSGTEGVSKQQTITQKTVTYGNNTITYWEADELNTGAAPVFSMYSVVSYLNQLIFPSSGGVTSIKTDPNLQGVLSPSIISEKIAVTYRTIKNTNFDKIVGAAWNNLIFMAVPSRGYNFNNQILVYDLTNKEKPKWYIWDLPADWIGSVTLPDRASFAYIRQGNEFYKLSDTYTAEDEQSDGTLVSFPMTVEGSLLPLVNNTRSGFFAATQAVVYVANFIGTFTLEVKYFNQKGRPKYKSKEFTNGAQVTSLKAGWGNLALLYRSWNNRMINWSTPLPISGETADSLKITRRCRMRLPNPVINEAKFKITANSSGTSFDLVNGVYEGVNIGVIGDIV